jgi:hypothetical protein
MTDIQSTGRTRVADATVAAGPLIDLIVGMKPIVIDETRGFWEGTLTRELRVQVCGRCGNRQLPGGPCCATCLSPDLSWIKASGRGAVFSFAIVHQALHPAFMDKVPYVVADIELEEGPVMLSNVTDVDPREVRVGMPVEVWFGEENADAFGAAFRLPLFKPAR